jgi:hypothetical protein
MTDIALLKHLLTVLSLIGDHALPRETLGAELEIRSARHLTASQLAEVVAHAEGKGWIHSRVDRFTRTVFFISEAGRNALADL